MSHHQNALKKIKPLSNTIQYEIRIQQNLRHKIKNYLQDLKLTKNNSLFPEG